MWPHYRSEDLAHKLAVCTQASSSQHLRFLAFRQYPWHHFHMVCFADKHHHTTCDAGYWAHAMLQRDIEVFAFDIHDPVDTDGNARPPWTSVLTGGPEVLSRKRFAGQCGSCFSRILSHVRHQVQSASIAVLVSAPL